MSNRDVQRAVSKLLGAQPFDYGLPPNWAISYGQTRGNMCYGDLYIHSLRACERMVHLPQGYPGKKVETGQDPAWISQSLLYDPKAPFSSRRALIAVERIAELGQLEGLGLASVEQIIRYYRWYQIPDSKVAELGLIKDSKKFGLVNFKNGVPSVIEISNLYDNLDNAGFRIAALLNELSLVTTDGSPEIARPNPRRIDESTIRAIDDCHRLRAALPDATRIPKLDFPKLPAQHQDEKEALFESRQDPEYQKQVEAILSTTEGRKYRYMVKCARFKNGAYEATVVPAIQGKAVPNLDWLSMLDPDRYVTGSDPHNLRGYLRALSSLVRDALSDDYCYRNDMGGPGQYYFNNLLKALRGLD